MAMNRSKEKKVVSTEKPSGKDEKKKALQMAIAQIEKNFGKGAVMRLGQTSSLNVDCIPTGSMNLDMALGIGGVPKGRIIEIYGPESSGKTTVALQIAAETQKLGGEVAFIDVEHALDPRYAANLGVDTENMLISQPDCGEQALEIAETLIRSGAIECIVIDSVAAMVTKSEIEGEMGDTHVGQLARLMSQAMRKLTSVISNSNCVAIFINQVREKIGVMYGNPETTPGGRALKFYSSVRIEVRRGEALKNGTEIVGNRTKCKIVKNKVAPPFRECEFDMIYGKGISRSGEVLDLAADSGIIQKGGSWYSYGDVKLGQGRENVKKYLEENPEFMKEIERKIIEEREHIFANMQTGKKADKTEQKAAAAAGENNNGDNIKKAEEKTASKSDGLLPDDIDIETDENFEEFSPIIK